MYPNNWEVVYPAKKLKRIHHFNSVPEYANIPGRVTINDLPPELVVEIARNVANSIFNSGYVLDRHQEKHDADSFSIKNDFSLYNSRSLLQLSLCSSYLHRLVQPVLYERFHYNAQASTKGFVLFLIRILARPDLGKWIRVFHVDGAQAPNLGMVIDEARGYKSQPYTEDYKDRFKSDFDMSWLTPEDLMAARKKIAEAGATATDCYEWAMGVETGNLNAMVALMLTLMPNLQVLDVDVWTDWAFLPPIITQILGQTGRLQRERQLGHPLAFGGLIKIVLRYFYNTDNERAVHHIISLLMIPSVETFCAIDQNAATWPRYPSAETDVNEQSFGAALQGGHLELANMKELSLSFTAIRPKSLFRLWRCCPNLKKFYYKDSFGREFEDWMDPDECKDINLLATASCLIPHLQDLTILNMGYVWSSIKDSSIGPLIPLRGLRRLYTTWETLICRGDVNVEKAYFPSTQGIVDAMPRSLELLHISRTAYDEDCSHYDRGLAVIFELLEQKHRFPALKALDFGWKRRCPNMHWIYDNRYHPGFTEDDYREVKNRCQESSVKLILKPFTPSPKYISYRVDDDGKRTASGTNKVKHIVHYPYDDYEKICNENGCDPEIGMP